MKEDKKKSQVEPVEICADEIDNDVDGLVDEFECVLLEEIMKMKIVMTTAIMKSNFFVFFCWKFL
jgi:hypothetical protein